MLLEVETLETTFTTDHGTYPVINDVDLFLREGESLGIVGESGCGKSVTALSIMQLIPPTLGKITKGKVMFRGEDLTKKSEREMQQRVRGTEMSMIFQEPMTALNPVFRIGDQITETIRQHQRSNKSAAFDRAVEMLTAVGIPSPRNRMADYPHSLSGGMRQRVMIAMALACRPKILIADEPTTALDVTIQAQILDLLKKLQREFAMAVMLITHDLGVIAEFCNRVMVMYAGRVIERGTRERIFGEAVHPYTEGLLNSIPTLDEDTDRLHTVPGVVPSAYAMPRGCRFEPRCPYRMNKCADNRPPYFTIVPEHEISCYRYQSNNEATPRHERRRQ